MTRAQQTFVNQKQHPIYISIEINPECFELEPGDRLTLVYDLPAGGDALEVQFINDRELVIYPAVIDDQPKVLINGEPASGRSWRFKHA